MSQYAFDAYVPKRESNPLGLAGFICSIVGLVLTGGVLCPIGLILSLIALGRQPRGFAIAGVVVGLVGSCGAIVVVLAFGALILAALGIGVMAAFVAMNDPQRVEVTMDMANIAQAAEKYRAMNKVAPASLTELRLGAETLKDPWGRPYVYMLADAKPGFDVTSDGPDGKAGTTDDIALSRLEDLWNNYIQIKGDKGGGRVTLKVGDKEVLVHGDERGGRVTIDTGDQKINIVGGEGAGEVTVTEDTGAPADAPESSSPSEPDQPPAPQAPATPAPPS